jgi:hypothetical protein
LKKILLTGFGPRDNITHNGKIYRNGAVVEMEDAHADAYINANLAEEVAGADAPEALALQALEEKNAKRRDQILQKAKDADDVAKKAGEKV